MWNKVSLPLKITVPLVLIQILGLMSGGWILMAKIDEARLNEMDELLRGQAELISESILHNSNRLDLPEKSDLFRDLEKDSRIYFQLTNQDGLLIFASVGQGRDKRAKLAQELSRLTVPLEAPFDLPAEGETWRAIRKQIEYPVVSGTLNLTLHTALDETASIEELDGIRSLVYLGAIVLSILTTIATAAIVLLSTLNLRLFANNLAKIDPLDPKWSFAVRARSAEEVLLFTSFDKMMQDLVKARQVQKLFLANASHELKTPVAGMLAALEVLLARERSVADFQAICKELLKSVRHMKKLTGALLDTSLLEGDKALIFQTVDFRDVLMAVMERWEPVAKERAISMDLHLPETRMNVAAHPELLDVAISNLIDNAIKYNRDQGLLKVSLLVKDGRILLTIEDQGIGMDASTQTQLGEIFFRADAARSHRDSFGLGFANAKRILESHFAQLKVASIPGKGTRIEIAFLKSESFAATQETFKRS